VPGAAGAWITGINNAGIAVGGYLPSNGFGHGFRYDTVSGNLTTVDYPGTNNNKLFTINNNGVATGIFNCCGSSPLGWYTVDMAGNFKQITVPSPYVLTEIYGINDNGAISAVVSGGSGGGQMFAVIQPDGTVSLVPGGNTSIDFNSTRSLNNSLQMAVQGPFGSGLFDAGGTLTPVTYPGFPTRHWDFGTGLNNLGAVAGTVTFGPAPGEAAYAGFTRDPAGAYSEVICPGVPWDQRFHTFWYAINDNGVLAGNERIATPLPGQAQVTLSGNSLVFPQTSVGQTSAPQTVTLSNSGKARLDIILGGNDVLVGTCSGFSCSTDFDVTGCVDPQTHVASLDPGASCTMSVTAAPRFAGQIPGTLIIDDSAPGAPHTVALSVTAAVAPPTCQVSIGPPDQANFTIQDTITGLSSIVLANSVNATVNIPSFTAGTTSPVIATATQVNTAQSSRVDLQVTNTGNASTTCGTTFGGGSTTLTVTTSSLPNGTVGTPYSQALAASGGTGGYTWSITSGSLPDGLSLSSGGTIAGTPTTAVSNDGFTVQVRDSSGTTAAKALAITISAQAPPPLTVTTSSLPNGTAGTPYSQALAATGGTGGYTWSLASGSLPDGLTLSASGAIAGTPTTAVTNAGFTVQVRDSTGVTAAKALAITINAAAPSPTPQQQTLQIIAQVQALVNAGTLSQGEGMRLINTLNGALSRMNSGQIAPVCNQFSAFVNQMKALVASGALTAAQGQPLIDAASAIMTQLGC
jgi:hypothetical protein